MEEPQADRAVFERFSNFERLISLSVLDRHLTDRMEAYKSKQRRGGGVKLVVVLVVVVEIR